MTTAPPYTVRILVLSDPGMPTRSMSRVEERFRRRLKATFGPQTELLVRTGLFRIKPGNTLDLSWAEKVSAEFESVDAIFMLTEMPRHSGDRAVAAEFFPEPNVAVISCPALGVVNTEGRLLNLLVSCTFQMASARMHAPEEGHELPFSTWSHHKERGNKVLHVNMYTGGVRTVLGMARANQPLRTMTKLSSAMAAALATGAFGLFYTSIWQMANYLSEWRIGFIGVLAMAVMVAWLVGHNRLWDRPGPGRKRSITVVYNLSTVTTLFFCVFMLYAALVVAILVGSLIMISPEFLAQVLKEPDITPFNYVKIAWLSAALGVFGGAIGSSFDSETDLRQLTHGRREALRWYTEDELKLLS